MSDKMSDKPTAEDYSLPGKHGKVYEEFERDLQRFKKEIEMNHVDRKYQRYLSDILKNGHESGDRTGTGTIKSFGHQLEFDLQKGFPLLTSKAVWFEGVARELLWFLRGKTNIRPLVENGVSIWTDWPLQRYIEENGIDVPVDGDRYQTETDRYQEVKEQFETAIRINDDFAEKWGKVGNAYGEMWRDWPPAHRERYDFGGRTIDQISNLIDGLKNNPDSRRHLVDSWHGELHHPNAFDQNTALPPCHYAFQCFTRKLNAKERLLAGGHPKSATHIAPVLNEFDEKYPGKTLDEQLDAEGYPSHTLSLMWQQRSVDSFLGLPFNIASYALLTHMLAQQVNMVPEKLVFSGGDCHIYRNHLEAVEELLSRTPKQKLPTLNLQNPGPGLGLEDYSFATDIWIEDYNPHPSIEADIAV